MRRKCIAKRSRSNIYFQFDGQGVREALSSIKIYSKAPIDDTVGAREMRIGSRATCRTIQQGSEKNNEAILRRTGPSDAEREEAKKRVEAEAIAAAVIEAARKEREDFERKMARERKMMEWVSGLKPDTCIASPQTAPRNLKRYF